MKLSCDYNSETKKLWWRKEKQSLAEQVLVFLKSVKTWFKTLWQIKPLPRNKLTSSTVQWRKTFSISGYFSELECTCMFLFPRLMRGGKKTLKYLKLLGFFLSLICVMSKWLKAILCKKFTGISWFAGDFTNIHISYIYMTLWYSFRFSYTKGIKLIWFHQPLIFTRKNVAYWTIMSYRQERFFFSVGRGAMKNSTWFCYK